MQKLLINQSSILGINRLNILDRTSPNNDTTKGANFGQTKSK